MATVSPHVAVAEVKRIEPGFVAEPAKLVAKAPEVAAIPAEEPIVTEEKSAQPEVATDPVKADEPVSWVVVEETPHSTAADAVPRADVAEPEAAHVDAVAEQPIAKAAEADVITTIDAHEEPLTPQEPMPAMDPLGHAAPAAPDPSGAPTTPLPSFVRTTPSQAPGSSEVA
jgi:hypothetical protein